MPLCHCAALNPMTCRFYPELFHYISLLGHFTNIEADVQRCYLKTMFLEISQNLQENACARVSKVAGLRPFVIFVKFLITRFCIEHLLWLLLQIDD